MQKEARARRQHEISRICRQIKSISAKNIVFYLNDSSSFCVREKPEERNTKPMAFFCLNMLQELSPDVFQQTIMRLISEKSCWRICTSRKLWSDVRGEMRDIEEMKGSVGN
jgi:hypothetical protein